MCQVEGWILISKMMEKIVAVGNYWKDMFFRVMKPASIFGFLLVAVSLAALKMLSLNSV